MFPVQSLYISILTINKIDISGKPRSYKTNFTLGVTDTTGIDFSTFVIAYPEPFIKLEYENGTESDQMMKSINRKAVNNFTIHISKAVVNQSDFGVYHLKVWNSFGELTVIVNVIAQSEYDQFYDYYFYTNNTLFHTKFNNKKIL